MQQAKRAAATLAAWAIALAGLVPASNGRMPTPSTGTFVETAVKAPEPVAPKVAFTEAQSRIYEVSVSQENDSEPKLWGPAESTAFSAELSAGRGVQRFAYVSTEDSDQGEVYVPTDDDGSAQARITCGNEAAEFHPVISPDGTMLAYASDEKGN